MMRWVSGLVMVALGLILVPQVVLAADLESGLSARDLPSRIDFIEERLSAGQQHASTWQKGWTGVYSVSAAAQTVLWLDADESDDAINYLVGALKSAGGLADVLLRPMPGWKGAEKLRALPVDSPERLARGEELLQQTADRAAQRDTWKPHLKVVGVNLVAGAAIAAFGDGGDALVSTALGIAIGEAALWTQPVNGIADHADYQAQFGAQRSSLQWELLPLPAGGMARLTYRW